MSDCEHCEGLMAQSLYEALSDTEQSTLETHMASCPACRAESESLLAVKEFIPVEPVVFEGNLRPVLEERVRASTDERWIPRLAFFGMCATLALIAGLIFMDEPSTTSSEPVLVASVGDGPFIGVMRRVGTFIDEEDYSHAYVVLHEAINKVEDANVPSEARVMLADLAFERLRWYPEAHAAYEQIRKNEPEIFQASDEYIYRFSLLDEVEAMDTEFAPLRAWDRVIEDEDVDALGGYIAEYPGTLKASEAVQEMARLIIRDSNDDAMTLDSVLETAMASNENSIVVAQIKLELGRYYWKTVEDSDKARALFEDVEESSVLALAQEASQSLRALQSE